MALDAAMLVAVTAAEVGAVHKLRTGTRRVEAYMRLLELLESEEPAKPARYAKQADAVRRRLKKVRRAAGAVRDLDVQAEAIRYDAPAKSAVHEGSPGERMRQQAKQLRKHLKGQREAEAGKLIAVLQAEEQKLAASLRALEVALAPMSEPSLTSASLARSIKAWFVQTAANTLKVKPGTAPENLRLAIGKLSDDQLHNLRKAAKLCRYMAESAPEGTRLRGTAGQFEAVQEAGGKWHDWLLLAKLSRRFHGSKADLTCRYLRHRDAALAEYRLKLAEMLPLLTRR